MATAPQEGQLPVALTKIIAFHTYKWYLPIQLTIYPFLKLESTSRIHVLQRPFHKKCVHKLKTDTFHSPKYFPTKLSKLNKRLGGWIHLYDAIGDLDDVSWKHDVI